MRPPVRRRFAASRMVLNVPFRLIGDVAVEERVVVLGERRHMHDAGVVDQHIDAAEGGFRRIEHPRDGGGIADIGLGGAGLAAGLLDLLDQGLGRRGIAGCSSR